MLLLVCGLGCAVAIVVVVKVAPCDPAGLSSGYATADVLLLFVGALCFAGAVGLHLRGGRGVAVGFVVFVVSGFVLFAITSGVWRAGCPQSGASYDPPTGLSNSQGRNVN